MEQKRARAPVVCGDAQPQGFRLVLGLRPALPSLRVLALSLVLCVAAPGGWYASALQHEVVPGQESAPGNASQSTSGAKSSVVDLLAELGVLIVDGERARAMERAEEALGSFEAVGDAHGQATCLTFLGFFDSGEKGIGHLERSLRLLTEVRKPFQAASVARFLGVLLRGNSRLEQAESYLRQGLDLLHEFDQSRASIPGPEYWLYASMLGLPSDLSELRDPFSDATRRRLVQMAEGSLRDSLGDVLTWQGRLDEAEAELGRSLRLAGSARSKYVWQVLLHLAILQQEQGRYDEAHGRFAEALAFLESPAGRSVRSNREERIGVYELQARLDRARGRPREALALNARDLEAARSKGDRLAVAMLLKNRGKLLHATGDLVAARQALEEARDLAFEVGDSHLEEPVLSALGGYALETGSHEEAASYLEQTVARCRANASQFGELMAWARLAMSYLSLGADERARRAIEEARKLAPTVQFPEGRKAALLVAALGRGRERGGDLSEASRIMENLFGDPQSILVPKESQREVMRGTALAFERGDPQEIERAARAAVAAARRDGSLHYEAVARGLLGHAHLRQGRRPAARREWEEALRIHRLRGSQHLEATVLGGLADLAWVDGRTDEAVRLALESVDVLEKTLADVRVDDLFVSFLGEHRKLFERAVVALVKTGRTGAAFGYTERARARALLRLLSNQRLRPTGSADASFIAELEVLRSKMSRLEASLAQASGGEATALQAELQSAWRRYDDLVVRIQLVNPRYAELVRPDPVDLHTVQTQVLGPETTLISFFVLLDEVVAWVIDRKGFAFLPTGMSRQELDLVSCFTFRILAGRPRRGTLPLSGCDEARDLEADLYEKLVAPLLPHIRHRNLILVPHGLLHTLPFAALRNPETGRYLIQDYTLTYAPSASVLRSLQEESDPIGGRILVMGDPQAKDPGLAPLPGARQEARAVARLFGTEPLLGSDATESRVRRLAGEVDILHLAAHGIYRRQSPRFSHLALAPGDGHDGRLEMNEVFGELDLSGVNLVVLSACQTALGRHSGGDEVVGLIRAFLYAGSSAVLATHWSVDDDASAVLMVGFYRRLLDGQPAAKALRQAQLEMLGREGYASPYYWAGFALVGEALGEWGRFAAAE